MIPDDSPFEVTEQGSYSEVADEQLDELEAGADAGLYDAALRACELIFGSPGLAQSMSAAITTADGIIFRLPVPERPEWKVFWSSSRPRVEAVLRYPT